MDRTSSNISAHRNSINCSRGPQPLGGTFLQETIHNLELGHIIKSGTIRDRNQVKHPIPSLAEFHALQERTGSTDGVSHHTNYSSRNKNFRLFSDSLRMGSFIKARRSRASRFCPHGYQSICSQELNQLQTEISSEDTFFKEPKGTLQ